MNLDRRLFLGLLVRRRAASSSSADPADISDAAFSVTSVEWRKILGPQRYAVLREAAAERPFSISLLNEHPRGIFACAGCALRLLDSTTKCDSGTGWPSFCKALPRAVVTRADHRLMMERTEILCARCGGHLGYLFDDGPRPTGLRYCMNGLALNFRPV